LTNTIHIGIAIGILY